MAKAKTERRLNDNEAQAVARTLRVSPQKLNLVAAMIRGKKVDRALAELEFSRKRIAGTVKKRSEEHTSELQSLMRISYAVFCLKNKKKTNMSNEQLRHIIYIRISNNTIHTQPAY